MLNSDTYTEFFLSDRVSKIQRTLFVQNGALRTNETGRNLPLKCRGVWFSPVIGFRYIPLQCSARICQHTWGPLALVPLFRSQNSLAKSFTVFVTDFAEIFWEKNPSGTPKSGFSDSYCIPQLCTKSTGPAQHPDSSLLCDFLRSTLQILLNDSHAFLSVSFGSSSNCLSCISSLIWSHINIPSWSLRHSHLGTCSSHIRIHGWFYPYVSQSFSWGPVLCAKWADKFSPEEQQKDWRHFSPLASVIFV